MRAYKKVVSDKQVNAALIKFWKSQEPDPEDVKGIDFGHSVQQVRRALTRANMILSDIERALIRNDGKKLSAALTDLDKLRCGKHPLFIEDLLGDCFDIAEAMEDHLVDTDYTALAGLMYEGLCQLVEQPSPMARLLKK